MPIGLVRRGRRSHRRRQQHRIPLHVRAARKNAVGLHVEVHEAITGKDRVAARYTLTATMRKGAVIATEIYMFGRLDSDGRLRSVCQATRSLPAG